MTTNILYKKLIRLVHPDLNSNMPEAIERSQKVNINKNNFDVLKRLGLMWKLLTYKDFGEEPPRQFYRTSNNVLHVGSYVTILKTSIAGEVGILLEIRTIKKGRYADYEEYIIGTQDRNIYKFKVHRTSLNKYFKLGIVAPRSEFASLKNKYVNMKYKTVDAFGKFGLVQNRDYSFMKNRTVEFIRGRYKYSGVLIRTTKKCIYVLYCGKEWRVNIDKVLDVI
jgi:hypothetical protein